MSQINQNRDLSIDIAKGIGIILVVWGINLATVRFMIGCAKDDKILTYIKQRSKNENII